MQLPWRPWKEGRDHQYATGCTRETQGWGEPHCASSAVRKAACTYRPLPPPRRMPGDRFPERGQGSIPGVYSFDWPLNSLQIGISTTFLPQGRGLASTVFLGPAKQHLSSEGWELDPGVYLRTAQWEAAGMAGDLQESDWRGLGSSLGRDLQPGASPAAASRAQPTSQPHSWQSAGTVHGRSPSGCARPG